MYSVQIAVSDGTLTRIALSIEYFEKDDITLYRNLELTPLVLGTDWQWDGDTHINLITDIPVPVGSYITVRRNTNIDRAFNIYDGGAAFNRESLDENFRQMIYLAQEFTEGNGLTGLFFPLDMHGFQIKNLGDGVDPKDAVNKGQLDVVDQRVTNLEGVFVTSTTSYPWYEVTTVEKDTFTPPFVFTKAAVYIDGICQVPGYSYIVESNQILLADPVPIGTVFFARLGEDVGTDPDYATGVQLAAAIAASQAADAVLQTNIDNKANKGVNSDITSLTGLTTPLSASQGGTGSTTGNAPSATKLATARTFQTDLGSTGTASFDGTANASPGVQGTLGIANGGTGGTTASAARTNLGLGNSATRDVGTTSTTVLAGNAPGRLIAVQRILASGTYTPTAGMTSCIMDIVGGGGAGGGAPTTGAAQIAAGAGGNSGAYLRMLFTAAQIGASQAVTIGAGGTAVSGAAGGNGAATTIGTLVSCPGGTGGGTTGAITAIAGGSFTFPGTRTQPTITTGTTLLLGWNLAGEYGIATTTTTVGGAGANSMMGSGALHTLNGVGAGAPGSSGGGGGGAASPASTAARAGGNGANGIVVIYEYS